MLGNRVWATFTLLGNREHITNTIISPGDNRQTGTAMTSVDRRKYWSTAAASALSADCSMLAVQRQKKPCLEVCFDVSAARQGRQMTKHAVQIEQVHRQLMSVRPRCRPACVQEATCGGSSSTSKASVLGRTIVTDPTIRQSCFDLPRHTWSPMNRFQKVKANVMPVCMNGVSPNHLPVIVAGDGPWTTLTIRVHWQGLERTESAH